jgi:hypothetical protein
MVLAGRVKPGEKETAASPLITARFNPYGAVRPSQRRAQRRG